MRNRASIMRDSGPSPPGSQSRQRSSSQTRAGSLNSLLLPSRTLLTAHASNDLLNIRLNNHTTNDHLAQHPVHSLIAKDQIELTNILKHAVQCFDEDLDQIDQGERGLGRGGDHDEGERGVGAVGYLRGRIGGPG